MISLTLDIYKAGETNHLLPSFQLDHQRPGCQEVRDQELGPEAEPAVQRGPGIEIISIAAG